MGSFSVVVMAFLLAGGATSFSIFGGSQSSTQPSMPVADVKGRLLTVEEGCGHSIVKQKKIVGGSEAQVGKLFQS